MSAGGLRGRDAILAGPIGSTLVSLAWPLIATALLGDCQNFISFFWIGRLNGTAGLATLSVMAPVITVLSLIAGTANTGVQLLTARKTGERDGEAIPIMINGTYLAASWAIAVSIVGLVLLGPITEQLAGKLEIAHNLRSYLIPWFVFYVFPVVSGVAVFAVNGTGWTRFGLIQNVVSIGLLFILMPTFVGLFGLGIAGVALSDGVSDALLFGLACYALYRFRGDLGLGKWQRSDWKLSFKWWRAIVSVGLYYQLARAMDVIGQLVLVRVIMESGKAAIAGWGVMMQLIIFTTGPLSCIGSAMGIMIAQNVGAGNEPRAVACLRRGVMYLFGLGVLLFLLATFFSEPAFRIFTDDEATIASARATIDLVKWVFPSVMTSSALLRAYTAVSPNKLGNMLSIACGCVVIAIASVWPGTPVQRVGAAWITGSYLRLTVLIIAYPWSFKRAIRNAIASRQL